MTPETVYLNRRHFIKGLVGAGRGASLMPFAGCQELSSETALEASLKLPKIPSYTTDPDFATVDRPMTEQELAGRYNNFYIERV